VPRINLIRGEGPRNPAKGERIAPGAKTAVLVHAVIRQVKKMAEERACK
jgi:hypothetical protein